MKIRALRKAFHSTGLAVLLIATFAACSPKSSLLSENDGAETEAMVGAEPAPPSNLTATHAVCPRNDWYATVPIYQNGVSQKNPPSVKWVKVKAHAGAGLVFDRNGPVINTVENRFLRVFYLPKKVWGYIAVDSMVKLEGKTNCETRFHQIVENAPEVKPPTASQPAKPGVPSGGNSSDEKKSAAFADWYIKNYEVVKNAVHRDTHNGCSRFATTAINMGAVKFKYQEWAQHAADDMTSRGWTLIAPDAMKKRERWKEVRKGDIMTSQDEATPGDGVTNHIMIVTGVAEPGVSVYISDNQDNHYVRRFDGTDGKSKVWGVWRIKW